MKNLLITIALIVVSTSNTPSSYANDSAGHQKKVKKNENTELSNRQNELNEVKKKTPSARPSSTEEYRERLKQIANRPQSRSLNTKAAVPMPALPFQGSSSTKTPKTNRTNTKQSNKSKKTNPTDSSSNILEGEWLKRNYQLQVTVEMILDDGKKTVYVTRWVISQAHMKSSDIIGFSGGAPMTSEFEATIENAKDNKLLISLLYGVQMPYNARPKTTSSSSRGFGGYTQFLNLGLETGVQVELGKPITIWDTEKIKLTLMAKNWNAAEGK